MKSKSLFFIFLIAFVCWSCKKSNTSGPLASLNIVNAMMDGPNLAVNFSDTTIPFYLNQAFISYGSALEYGRPAGSNSFFVISSNDTVKPLLNANLNLAPGTIYSLFLAGQGRQVDTIFIRDVLPLHKDSTSGVRFINLSPDSHPFSINLEGNDPGQTEFPSIKYREITSFKNYVVSPDISYYNFELRDQTTGDILSTFSWNVTFFKNSTIVISGSVDPSSATPLNVFQVNNY